MLQKKSSQRISNQLSNFRREGDFNFGSGLEGLEEIFENREKLRFYIVEFMKGLQSIFRKKIELVRDCHKSRGCLYIDLIKKIMILGFGERIDVGR